MARSNKLTTTKDGIGPLLRRVYHAKVIGSHLRAEEVMRRVAGSFPSLAPSILAEFSQDAGHTLTLGDEMTVKMPLMAPVKVRVVHQDAKSMTLQTVAGHPEAGQISFACERDGKVLSLRIASRARAASFIDLCGYFVAGRAMQTRVWKEFLARAAEVAGGRLAEPVSAATEIVREREADRVGTPAPTFHR